MAYNATILGVGLTLDTQGYMRDLKSAGTVTSRVLSSLDAQAQNFADRWSDVTRNLRSVKSVASSLALYGAFRGVSDAISAASSAVLTFTMNMENAAVSMEYFVEGSDKAAKSLEYLREMQELAAKTSFTTESAVNLSQFMSAMGINLKATKSIMTVINDAAAATGASEANMSRIVTALGQILTKGRLAAEEIRQLANANIPIYEILKEQMGLTGDEIKNIGNYWIDANESVVAILNGLKHRYEGAAEKIAETMSGMTNSIYDNSLMISKVATSGAYDALETKVRSLRDTLERYREVAVNEGSTSLFRTIMLDLDATGKLGTQLLTLIGNGRTLINTLGRLYTTAKPVVSMFGQGLYASVNTLIIGFDALGEVINGTDELLSHFGLSLKDVFTIMSQVYVGYKVAKTFGYVGQAAAAGAMHIYGLGQSFMNLLPASIAASTGAKIAMTSILGLGAVALVASGAVDNLFSSFANLNASDTGLPSDFEKQFAEYEEAMAAYNDAIKQYEGTFDESFESIAENGANTFRVLSRDAAKSASKAADSWLASFDEVYKVPDDKDDGDTDELTFPDLASLIKDLSYIFPAKIETELEMPTFDWASVFSDSVEDGTTNAFKSMLPVGIAAFSLSMAQAFKKRFQEEQAKQNKATGKAPTVDADAAARVKLNDDIVRVADNASVAIRKGLDGNLTELKAISRSVDSLSAKDLTLNGSVRDLLLSTSDKLSHAIDTLTTQEKGLAIVQKLQASFAALDTAENSLAANKAIQAITSQALAFKALGTDIALYTAEQQALINKALNYVSNSSSLQQTSLIDKLSALLKEDVYKLISGDSYQALEWQDAVKRVNSSLKELISKTEATNVKLAALEKPLLPVNQDLRRLTAQVDDLISTFGKNNRKLQESLVTPLRFLTQSTNERFATFEKLFTDFKTAFNVQVSNFLSDNAKTLARSLQVTEYLANNDGILTELTRAALSSSYAAEALDLSVLVNKASSVLNEALIGSLAKSLNEALSTTRYIGAQTLPAELTAAVKRIAGIDYELLSVTDEQVEKLVAKLVDISASSSENRPSEIRTALRAVFGDTLLKSYTGSNEALQAIAELQYELNTILSADRGSTVKMLHSFDSLSAELHKLFIDTTEPYEALRESIINSSEIRRQVAMPEIQLKELDKIATSDSRRFAYLENAIISISRYDSNLEKYAISLEAYMREYGTILAERALTSSGIQTGINADSIDALMHIIEGELDAFRLNNDFASLPTDMRRLAMLEFADVIGLSGALADEKKLQQQLNSLITTTLNESVANLQKQLVDIYYDTHFLGEGSQVLEARDRLGIGIEAVRNLIDEGSISAETQDTLFKWLQRLENHLKVVSDAAESKTIPMMYNSALQYYLDSALPKDARSVLRELTWTDATGIVDNAEAFLNRYIAENIAQRNFDTAGRIIPLAPGSGKTGLTDYLRGLLTETFGNSALFSDSALPIKTAAAFLSDYTVPDADADIIAAKYAILSKEQVADLEKVVSKVYTELRLTNDEAAARFATFRQTLNTLPYRMEEALSRPSTADMLDALRAQLPPEIRDFILLRSAKPAAMDAALNKALPGWDAYYSKPYAAGGRLQAFTTPDSFGMDKFGRDISYYMLQALSPDILRRYGLEQQAGSSLSYSAILTRGNILEDYLGTEILPRIFTNVRAGEKAWDTASIAVSQLDLLGMLNNELISIEAKTTSANGQVQILRDAITNAGLAFEQRNGINFIDLTKLDVKTNDAIVAAIARYDASAFIQMGHSANTLQSGKYALVTVDISENTSKELHAFFEGVQKANATEIAKVVAETGAGSKETRELLSRLFAKAIAETDGIQDMIAAATHVLIYTPTQPQIAKAIEGVHNTNKLLGLQNDVFKAIDAKTSGATYLDALATLNKAGEPIGAGLTMRNIAAITDTFTPRYGSYLGDYSELQKVIRRLVDTANSADAAKLSDALSNVQELRDVINNPRLLQSYFKGRNIDDSITITLPNNINITTDYTEFLGLDGFGGLRKEISTQLGALDNAVATSMHELADMLPTLEKRIRDAAALDARATLDAISYGIEAEVKRLGIVNLAAANKDDISVLLDTAKALRSGNITEDVYTDLNRVVNKLLPNIGFGSVEQYAAYYKRLMDIPYTEAVSKPSEVANAIAEALPERTYSILGAGPNIPPEIPPEIPANVSDMKYWLVPANTVASNADEAVEVVDALDDVIERFTRAMNAQGIFTTREFGTISKRLTAVGDTLKNLNIFSNKDNFFNGTVFGLFRRNNDLTAVFDDIINEIYRFGDTNKIGNISGEILTELVSRFSRGEVALSDISITSAYKSLQQALANNEPLLQRITGLDTATLHQQAKELVNRLASNSSTAFKFDFDQVVGSYTSIFDKLDKVAKKQGVEAADALRATMLSNADTYLKGFADTQQVVEAARSYAQELVDLGKVSNIDEGLKILQEASGINLGTKGFTNIRTENITASLNSLLNADATKKAFAAVLQDADTYGKTLDRLLTAIGNQDLTAVTKIADELSAIDTTRLAQILSTSDITGDTLRGIDLRDVILSTIKGKTGDQATQALLDLVSDLQIDNVVESLNKLSNTLDLSKLLTTDQEAFYRLLGADVTDLAKAGKDNFKILLANTLEGLQKQSWIKTAIGKAGVGLNKALKIVLNDFLGIGILDLVSYAIEIWTTAQRNTAYKEQFSASIDDYLSSVLTVTPEQLTQIKLDSGINAALDDFWNNWSGTLTSIGTQAAGTVLGTVVGAMTQAFITGAAATSWSGPGAVIGGTVAAILAGIVTAAIGDAGVNSFYGQYGGSIREQLRSGAYYDNLLLSGKYSEADAARYAEAETKATIATLMEELYNDDIARGRSSWSWLAGSFLHSADTYENELLDILDAAYGIDTERIATANALIASGGSLGMGISGYTIPEDIVTKQQYNALVTAQDAFAQLVKDVELFEKEVGPAATASRTYMQGYGLGISDEALVNMSGLGATYEEFLNLLIYGARGSTDDEFTQSMLNYVSKVSHDTEFYTLAKTADGLQSAVNFLSDITGQQISVYQVNTDMLRALGEIYKELSIQASNELAATQLQGILGGLTLNLAGADTTLFATVAADSESVASGMQRLYESLGLTAISADALGDSLATLGYDTSSIDTTSLVAYGAATEGALDEFRSNLAGWVAALPERVDIGMLSAQDLEILATAGIQINESGVAFAQGQKAGEAGSERDFNYTLSNVTLAEAGRLSEDFFITLDDGSMTIDMAALAENLAQASFTFDADMANFSAKANSLLAGYENVTDAKGNVIGRDYLSFGGLGEYNTELGTFTITNKDILSGNSTIADWLAKADAAGYGEELFKGLGGDTGLYTYLTGMDKQITDFAERNGVSYQEALIEYAQQVVTFTDSAIADLYGEHTLAAMQAAGILTTAYGDQTAIVYNNPGEMAEKGMNRILSSDYAKLSDAAKEALSTLEELYGLSINVGDVWTEFDISKTFDPKALLAFYSVLDDDWVNTLDSYTLGWLKQTGAITETEDGLKLFQQSLNSVGQDFSAVAGTISSYGALMSQDMKDDLAQMAAAVKLTDEDYATFVSNLDSYVITMTGLDNEAALQATNSANSITISWQQATDDMKLQLGIASNIIDANTQSWADVTEDKAAQIESNFQNIRIDQALRENFADAYTVFTEEGEKLTGAAKSLGDEIADAFKTALSGVEGYLSQLTYAQQSMNVKAELGGDKRGQGLFGKSASPFEAANKGGGVWEIFAGKAAGGTGDKYTISSAASMEAAAKSLVDYLRGQGYSEPAIYDMLVMPASSYGTYDETSKTFVDYLRNKYRNGAFGFANGGIISDDGLYRIAEQNRKEAIIPLENPVVSAHIGEAIATMVIASSEFQKLSSLRGITDGGISSRVVTIHQPQVQQDPSSAAMAMADAVLQRILPTLSATNNSSDDAARPPVYVGTLIADDNGLRELNRKMKVIEARETRRA